MVKSTGSAVLDALIQKYMADNANLPARNPNRQVPNPFDNRPELRAAPDQYAAIGDDPQAGVVPPPPPYRTDNNRMPPPTTDKAPPKPQPEMRAKAGPPPQPAWDKTGTAPPTNMPDFWTGRVPELMEANNKRGIEPLDNAVLADATGTQDRGEMGGDPMASLISTYMRGMPNSARTLDNTAPPPDAGSAPPPTSMDPQMATMLAAASAHGQSFGAKYGPPPDGSPSLTPPDSRFAPQPPGPGALAGNTPPPGPDPLTSYPPSYGDGYADPAPMAPPPSFGDKYGTVRDIKPVDRDSAPDNSYMGPTASYDPMANFRGDSGYPPAGDASAEVPGGIANPNAAMADTSYQAPTPGYNPFDLRPDWQRSANDWVANAVRSYQPAYRGGGSPAGGDSSSELAGGIPGGEPPTQDMGSLGGAWNTRLEDSAPPSPEANPWAARLEDTAPQLGAKPPTPSPTVGRAVSDSEGGGGGGGRGSRGGVGSTLAAPQTSETDGKLGASLLSFALSTLFKPSWSGGGSLWNGIADAGETAANWDTQRQTEREAAEKAAKSSAEVNKLNSDAEYNRTAKGRLGVQNKKDLEELYQMKGKPTASFGELGPVGIAGMNDSLKSRKAARANSLAAFDPKAPKPDYAQDVIDAYNDGLRIEKAVGAPPTTGTRQQQLQANAERDAGQGTVDSLEKAYPGAVAKARTNPAIAKKIRMNLSPEEQVKFDKRLAGNQ